MPAYLFDHEQLDVFRLAVEVNRWFASARFPTGRAHLRDQGLRATDSVVLNLAEGLPNRREKMGKRHFRIALGSAAEAAAVLALLPQLEGTDDTLRKLRRVGAMLRALSR